MLKNFVIYAETEKFKVGDFIVIDMFKYTDKVTIHTHISNHDLYGIVTEIRENKSLTGKLLNGSTNLGGPSLSQMGPYQTSENIHFMWTPNNITDIDIKSKYPELLLI